MENFQFKCFDTSTGTIVQCNLEHLCRNPLWLKESIQINVISRLFSFVPYTFSVYLHVHSLCVYKYG